MVEHASSTRARNQQQAPLRPEGGGRLVRVQLDGQADAPGRQEGEEGQGKLTVHVKACVARGRDGKPLVYLAFGLGKWTPEQVVRAYRRRFGIEASYRQLGQCLARTCSRSERLRLVGVALVLGNLWGGCTPRCSAGGVVRDPVGTGSDATATDARRFGGGDCLSTRRLYRRVDDATPIAAMPYVIKSHCNYCARQCAEAHGVDGLSDSGVSQRPGTSVELPHTICSCTVAPTSL